jgi:alpha-amylase/alpha-mannosidase (GH57 family)
MNKKYLCIHGHFYQPPRENPWLDVIEVQDSAAPFHDWNERINRECYAPNTVSRSLDEGGRIKKIVNNFKHISFNIGPTLMSWLERYDPLTYDRILVADKISVERNDGHGNAIAQCYNHIIQPLATPRDRRTQVTWGIADFKQRFGREPEGMWLPETAVCLDSLEALVEAGIKYTILAQHQAAAIKNPGATTFTPLTGGIDPTRPYRCVLPSGKEIALYFYDGAISRAVAFEKLLATGERFVDRLTTGYSARRNWDQILSIATDGETFGHHHRFGEMALTYAIDAFRQRKEVTVTNYGAYLATHPPQVEVQIHERTAWSCAHGVERWNSDCSCAINPDSGYSQAWRRPLRDALDDLKKEIDHVYEVRGEDFFTDPWGARERYASVILDRKKTDSFLATESKREFSPTEKSDAMKLLEAQRNGMLMFTSCGWFFDDLAGIETVQILKYAARAIQLIMAVSESKPEERFLTRLAHAHSNDHRLGDGRSIYRHYAEAESASLSRAVANHAITAALVPGEATPPFGFGYETKEEDITLEEYGDNALAISKMGVRSTVTSDERRYITVTLRLSKSDVSCFTRRIDGEVLYADVVDQLVTAWRSQPLTHVIRKIDELFGAAGETFEIRDLFVDTRRIVVSRVVAEHLERFAETYRKLMRDNSRMMDYFIDAGVPIPEEFRLSAHYIVANELYEYADDLTSLEGLERFTNRMADINRWGLSPNLDPVRKKIEADLGGRIDTLVRNRDLVAAPAIVRALLAAQSTSLKLDLWRMQNSFADAYFSWFEKPIDPFFSSPEIKKVGIMLNFAYPQ